MTFHSVGNFIIPTDQVIFFRGVETTNQIYNNIYIYIYTYIHISIDTQNHVYIYIYIQLYNRTNMYVHTSCAEYIYI